MDGEHFGACAPLPAWHPNWALVRGGEAVADIGIGPNVRCGASVQVGPGWLLEVMERHGLGDRLGCALSPADGHTQHETAGAVVCWEGLAP